MATNAKSELTKAIADLADGFISLEEEFRTLASQHDSLKRQLALMAEQRQALKSLIPHNPKAIELLDTPVDTDIGTTSVTRTVTDWIGELRGATDSNAQKSISKIRDAEFACFKIREKLKDREIRLDESRENASDAGKLGPVKRERGVSFTDMERDHTTSRTAGQLGCPYATTGPQKNGVPPTYAKSHDLPTPRSSGSQLDLARSRSQRPSFNDPIRPEVEISEASEQGPACPIRFLDQHSPEDVARYFEEHKHELPRSHEYCVKRFQTNSQSIKELDAKYGNLVTMIQGLGQKHQPMLPEAPNVSEPLAVFDDSKSTQRVKKWAKAVSEGYPGEPKAPDDEPDVDAKSEGGDEERVPRFHRPLKEIRVGESPSRPWGVPIPLKYLDGEVRRDSYVAEGLDPKEPAMQTKGDDAAKDDVKPTERPKGKCPFGHGAPGAVPANAAPAAPAPEPRSIVKAQETNETKPHKPALKPTVPSSMPQVMETEGQGPTIRNNGIAVISDPAKLGTARFDNKGTLILGYSSSEAQEILRSVQK